MITCTGNNEACIVCVDLCLVWINEATLQHFRACLWKMKSADVSGTCTVPRFPSMGKIFVLEENLPFYIFRFLQYIIIIIINIYSFKQLKHKIVIRSEKCGSFLISEISLWTDDNVYLLVTTVDIKTCPLLELNHYFSIATDAVLMVCVQLFS
jgi:hypothetical protein